MLRARFRVVPDGVAVGKGAALGILASQAHRHALPQQRAEGHHLATAPVDGYLASGHGAARFDHPLDCAVQREAFRDLGRPLDDPL